VRRDLFTKATTINATFEADASEQVSRSSAASDSVPGKPGTAKRTVRLRIESKSSTIVLNVNEAPKSIGRAAAGNALRIDDESVSRMHCSIALKQSGEIVISDLGSANGTAVSGVRLRANEARQLHAGDEIVIGDVRVRVEVIE
jgi:pSer/pThr/pTyr-binding forkhead associated (FHA) protein